MPRVALSPLSYIESSLTKVLTPVSEEFIAGLYYEIANLRVRLSSDRELNMRHFSARGGSEKERTRVN